MRRSLGVALAFRDLLLTVVVLIVASPLWFLPWRAAVAIGGACGTIGSLFWGKARRAGMINLKRAFPHLSRSEARALTAQVFRNMGRSLVEGIQFSRRSGRIPDPAAPTRGTRGTPRNPRNRVYMHEDPELARRILEDPRPKIFVTAHLGSWEVALMIARSVVGDRGAVIARSVDNRFLDAVVRKIRFDRQGQWIEKRGAIPEALERLRQGTSVAMLIDENGGPRGPHVDFFGRRASTRKTPALLSVMTGAPIVVGAALRREGEPFLFRLAVLDPATDGEGSVVAITATINGILERWVRDDVTQWRWIHWRWRARPDGSSETYTRADLRACFASAARHAADAGARGTA